jgi:hypothetical protein
MWNEKFDDGFFFQIYTNKMLNEMSMHDQELSFPICLSY